MADPAQQQSPHESVDAALRYLVKTGQKPRTYVGQAGKSSTEREAEFKDHVMTIRNGRLGHGERTLDSEGFVFTPHETKVESFFDTDEVKAVYDAEAAELVKRFSGASRVHVFDHTLRVASDATRTEKKLREPVRVVHNDYTEKSGPQRVRDLLPDEADDLLQRRFAVVQVWRPIRKRVQELPLAICDAQSIAASDFVPTDLVYKDRIGEVLQIAHNPDHRWFYFPEMARNEALVFKCYDSMTDGRSRFSAHSAFDDPTSPSGASPRESIETRTLAFF
jgi:hypothetical protein